TASSRQRTLRAALEWSWRLLDPWEQAALAQCSVFRGGIALEAAERVLDPSGAPNGVSCLDMLQRLRDKSLLRTFVAPEAAGALRFGLYESIRELASEKLGEDAGARSA